MISSCGRIRTCICGEINFSTKTGFTFTVQEDLFLNEKRILKTSKRVFYFQYRIQNKTQIMLLEAKKSAKFRPQLTFLRLQIHFPFWGVRGAKPRRISAAILRFALEIFLSKISHKHPFFLSFFTFRYFSKF